MKALAVDLGGSHATCALVEDATILDCRTMSTVGMLGLGEVLPQLSKTLTALLPNGESRAEVAGLALGFCGLVDGTRNRILATNSKYDDGPSLDLVLWCRSSLRLPLQIENDARMALLGEWYAGAARGCHDLVMVTLGTGIGGAAMVRGQLLRGKHFQAGCLGGHLSVHFHGRDCTCGAIGCAEAEASTFSLPSICRMAPGYEYSKLAQDEPITFEQLFLRAEQDDSVASGIRDYCLQVWGAATVNLIHAYDPEIVVFGGGVMKNAAAVLPFLQTYVEQHAWTPWGKVRLLNAELGNEAALLGAVPLLQGIATL